MERELRKNQSILFNSGTAVIAFEVWSVLKAILLMVLEPEWLEEAGYGTLNVSGKIFLFVLLGVICLISLGLRTIVGLSARAEANGKKKGVFYLIVAFVVALVSIGNVIIVFTSASNETVFMKIISIILEGSSLFASVEVVVSAIKVKKLTKQLQEKEMPVSSSAA